MVSTLIRPQAVLAFIYEYVYLKSSHQSRRFLNGMMTTKLPPRHNECHHKVVSLT